MRRSRPALGVEQLEPRCLLSTGTLFSAEGFDAADYGAGSLAGSNPLVAAFDGPWTGSAAAAVREGSLSYPGFGEAGGNRVRLARNSLVARPLLEGNNGPLGNYNNGAGDIGTSRDGSALYLSFLVQMRGLTRTDFALGRDGTAAADRQLVIRFAPSRRRFQLMAGPGGDVVNLGSRRPGANLFVVKIEFQDGPDTISLWKNPEVGGDEPAPDIQLADLDLAFDRVAFARHGLRGKADFDELRFAGSWWAATHADALGTLPGPQAIAGMEVRPPSPLGGSEYPYGFFPFIDRFGQYRHADWPEKVHSLDELAQRRAGEAFDLAANPGPASWDAYGGWAAGPQLEATGFFRVEKYEGKWWLVDPEGRLFFSHGLSGVRGPEFPSVVVLQDHRLTGVTGREDSFAHLPQAGDPTAGFLADVTSTVIGGHYSGTRPLAMNFFAANLREKYGEEWQAVTDSLAHDRLRSWGLNTLGGWSDPNIFLQDRTPYTQVLFPDPAPIVNTDGRVRDYFDPVYAANVRARMELEVGVSIGDPWNLGYYVHNELEWAWTARLNFTEVGLQALGGPATRHAKIAFRDLMQEKYGDIEALNGQWQTAYTSWDDFLAQRTVVPNPAGANADLLAFYAAYADQYFRVTSDAVREFAPQHLYLGSRFANGIHAEAGRAAARYVDVISINRYGFSLNVPAGLEADVPLLSTEFHFSARDTGLFSNGVFQVPDQAERAVAYQSYVDSALTNPRYVGVHWFDYWDGPPSGTLGGRNRNNQIGFLTVADTPYQATVAAAREVGARLYETRLFSRGPTADATVRGGGFANQNFGAAATLTVKTQTPDVTREAFLRFDLSDLGGDVARAVVRLAPITVGSAHQNAAAFVDDDSWDESTITWNNRPSSGPAFAVWTPIIGRGVEIDVTELVREALAGDRMLSLRIFSPADVGDSGIVDYGAREGNVAQGPRLLIVPG